MSEVKATTDRFVAAMNAHDEKALQALHADDIKFDAKHFKDIDRLAMVGDKTWERGMSMFCRPFTTATVRYFDREAGADARAWLRGD